MNAPATETVVIDCTPTADVAAQVAPGDVATAWMWSRLKMLEESRQTLHRERDEARARVVDLEAEVARLEQELIIKADTSSVHAAEVAGMKNTITAQAAAIGLCNCGARRLQDEVEALTVENARLRAHLAAAGLALDGLTAP